MRLGPISVGDDVGGGRVVAIARAAGEAIVTVELAGGQPLAFALTRTVTRRGPFAALPALTYRATALPFAGFAAVGAALATRLAPAWPAVLDEAAAPTSWPDAIRALGDDPWATRALVDLLPAEALARRACVAPWTRLEYGRRDQYGPCCADFQAAPALGHADPLTLWRSPHLREFRRALAAPRPPSTCRATCPRLVGRSDTLAGMIVRGGPPAFLANQIGAVTAILDGDDDPPTTPLELVCSATSYCNYDCLMCSHGELGSLADELPAAFYAALAPLLPGLNRLEVLGGEPLASPVLREVLAGPLLATAPHVEVALTTNGSYLTPTELARYRHVRLGHVTVSLNAATAATYAAVNRGLPLARVRAHLDALLAAHRAHRNPVAITYSMVLLRGNVHELEAFAALAEADDVAVRFMLPMGDRNHASILCDPAAMRAAVAGLTAVAARLRARGRAGEALRVDGEAGVLTERLRRGLVRALPD
ncbi:MAG: radical SAM protein [Myxococcales bacterium]|nr:radical SAM protein [Myxococcales bacterium]